MIQQNVECHERSLSCHPTDQQSTNAQNLHHPNFLLRQEYCVRESWRELLPQQLALHLHRRSRLCTHRYSITEVFRKNRPCRYGSLLSNMKSVHVSIPLAFNAELWPPQDACARQIVPKAGTVTPDRLKSAIREECRRGLVFWWVVEHRDHSCLGL